MRPSDARDFRHLPERVTFDQLCTGQPPKPPNDPDLGRDPNHDWLLRGV
jgi:hypothetical protein